MRTNTSIPHIFSRKGACVRDVLDEYNDLTKDRKCGIVSQP